MSKCVFKPRYEFCADCIHHTVCMWQQFPQDPSEHCQFYKDKSLFVELPCPIGTKINSLSFIGIDYEKTKEKHKKYYILRCDCGNIKSIRKDLWESGNTKACGCLYETHGQAKGEHSRIYEIYYGMKKRCFNVKNKAYKNYGGRGITICNEWLGANGFVNFYKWAISNGYRDNLTIDRIDVNGDYKPNNCRWVTMEIQHKNTTKTFPIQIIETGQVFNTISDCARHLKTSGGNISNCLNGKSKSCKGYHFKRLDKEEAEAKIKEIEK